MKVKARKLGLKDKGIYPNHQCACGEKARLGEDGNGQTWSWCPKCRCKINLVAVPRFPKGSLIKVEPHDD